MLTPAALDSTKQSRFECRACSAPVSYLLVYSFKLTTAGDCCDAFSVPPQVEQAPESIDPQGRPQTQVSIATEQNASVTRRPSGPVDEEEKSLVKMFIFVEMI